MAQFGQGFDNGNEPAPCDPTIVTIKALKTN